MRKPGTAAALTLPARPRRQSAVRWLNSALRAQILDGRLRPGARLPASRDLARVCGVARGTVVAAFEQLIGEGYLVGAVGSGTYVSRVLPDDLLQVTNRRPAPSAPPPGSPPVSDFGRRVRPFPADPYRPTRAFRSDLPALDLFPTTLWAQVAGRRLRRATVQDLRGCGPMGYRPLQEAVADYLRQSRGANCDAGQIAIVSGLQEVLDLVARLLLDPGDTVCLENPGYMGAALVFEAHGARVRPVPVDDDGMTVPSRRLRRVRLAYVTPGHQAPLGICMSLPRRLALLEWARTTGALILEDDYDSEYRYVGRPVPAMQGLDRHAQVLLGGSFNKVLFPSLRLGYLVVPPPLVDVFAAARSVTARHAPLLDQAILCDFMVDGHFGRHLRRMREIYAERRSVLLECARERLAGLFEIVGVEAGLQTAGWLLGGRTAADAARVAARREVEVTPLDRYSIGPMTREGLQLGFGATDTVEIRRGIRELAIALEELRPG